MKKLFFILFLTGYYTCSLAQFAPRAGQAGSTAIHKDSSAFVAWATGCSVQRGFRNISTHDSGYATTGTDNQAIGKSGNGGVSLGDSGIATLTFSKPITNDSGWDFAVFENSFSDTFLELAFVEVSSDGINFFRFPATSLTQDTVPLGSFGFIEPRNINNLAGKYRATFGTPFDLEELNGTQGLNIQKITHVRIVDVVGTLNDSFAGRDSAGRKVNDPWPTPFESCGFDLDAVGVIHEDNSAGVDPLQVPGFAVYPNPARAGEALLCTNFGAVKSMYVFDHAGRLINGPARPLSQEIIPSGALSPGIYMLLLSDGVTETRIKLTVINE